MPNLDDHLDPKKPHPSNVQRKREGAYERSEARKDGERDHHRHVDNVRC